MRPIGVWSQSFASGSLSLASNSASFGSLAVSESDSAVLRLLSWNVYLLPAHTFMRTGQVRRSRLIARLLAQSNYDIIVLNEAFHTRARRILAKALRSLFPYQTAVLNKRFGIKTNGGIWIISRIPLKTIASTQFDACSGIDCLSRKGALMVEAEKDGVTFQIIGTHLQADESAEKQAIRQQQYQQIYDELLKPFARQGVSQWLCGDFNTPLQEKSYQDMLRTINAEDGAVLSNTPYTWPTNDYQSPNTGQYWFDYILFRPNGTTALPCTRHIRRFGTEWHSGGKKRYDLSDHYAIDALIRLR